VSTLNTDNSPPKYRYVKGYADKLGQWRYYYRRKGCASVALTGQPGSIEFAASYDTAAQQQPAFRARSKQNMGYVYAIRVAGFDLVKIGYSLAPKRRLAELASGSGMADGLSMILSFPAKPAVERALHRKFDEARLFGEWFRLSGAIQDWLEANSCLPGRRLASLSALSTPNERKREENQ
jgi:hypothetical protein